jgi:hypothetical protein
MTTDNIKELKKKTTDAYSQREKVLSKFTDDLLSQDGISVPSGFKMEVRVDYNKDLAIYIKDNNRKDGADNRYPKYFWTMDNNVVLTFKNGELTNYDSRTAHGGYNGSEYANKTAPKIDLITIQELLMEINGSQLNIMKLAKSKPTIFLKCLNDYTVAENKHLQLQEKYSSEQTKLQQEERDLDIATIKNTFQNITSEKVTELKNRLIESDKYEETVSIMLLKEPKCLSRDEVKFQELNIKCKHGDKMTFSATINGGEGQKRIKASELETLLSSAITVNGKFVDSVPTLLKSVDRLVLNNIIEDLNRGYINTKHSFTAPIKTICEISEDLSREHNEKLDSSLGKYTKPQDEGEPKQRSNSQKP